MTDPTTNPDRTIGTDLDALADRMVEIWRSVLRDVEVGLDSHLLDLGGTSLTAVRIRSRVLAEFGKEIELVDFLDHPTPRALAAVVTAAPRWRGPQSWQQIDWEGDAGGNDKG